MSYLLQFEGQIRLASFISIFLIMALWELKAPYRNLRLKKIERWPHQLLLIVINTLSIRLLFPVAAVGTAQYCQSQGLGLFNWLHIPFAIQWVGGFLLLDFAIYWQHVFAHRWHWFWKLHRTHHADTDYDLTTGLRFHPIEIILSMLIKMLIVFVLGIPVISVIIFEIVLSASAVFNHSNIRLPDSMEFALRKIIVTPSMHRIHHSIERYEHDSNYGFFLSVWDRIFNSYTHQATADDSTMPIGLKIFREPENRRLDKILRMPFSDQ